MNEHGVCMYLLSWYYKYYLRSTVFKLMKILFCFVSDFYGICPFQLEMNEYLIFLYFCNICFMNMYLHLFLAFEAGCIVSHILCNSIKEHL
jgi:hypothetical protein